MSMTQNEANEMVRRKVRERIAAMRAKHPEATDDQLYDDVLIYIGNAVDYACDSLTKLVGDTEMTKQLNVDFQMKTAMAFDVVVPDFFSDEVIKRGRARELDWAAKDPRLAPVADAIRRMEELLTGGKPDPAKIAQALSGLGITAKESKDPSEAN